MARKRTQKNASESGEIDFDYIKSPFFRTVHVDGVFGGISPGARYLNLALFSERRAIPTKTVHGIGQDGTLSAELVEKREGRLGVVRELEVNLAIDLPTAIALRQWLDGHMSQMMEISKKPTESDQDAKE